MITVVLYTHPDDARADEVRALLDSLQDEVPHRVAEVDVSQNAGLEKALRGQTPVLKIGPYRLQGEFDRVRVLVTLKAAAEGRAQGRAMPAYQVTASDRFMHWFSKHWLLVFNVIAGLYLGFAFLAPVLMKAGWTTPARVIYKAYSYTCHQLAFRSWFLFGEQPAYPRALAHVEGLKTYGEATGLPEDNSREAFYTARAFIGNERLGYKVAMCERDVGIYGGMLLFGLLFGLLRRRLPPLPWYGWVLLGVVPILLDGGSQIVSQAVSLSFLPARESTPFLRTLTGLLFGFTLAWFGYPLVEASMRENREALEARFHVARAVQGNDG